LEGESASNPLAKLLTGYAATFGSPHSSINKPFVVNHIKTVGRERPVRVQGEEKQWQQHL
jgi:hypothetical protein